MEVNFLFDKKIVIFAILIGLFTISCVSAADNLTDDVIAIENQDDLQIASDSAEVAISDDAYSEKLSANQVDANSSEKLALSESYDVLSLDNQSHVVGIESSVDVLSSTSSRTFEIGGYTFTVPASDIKELKSAQKNHYSLFLKYPTGKYLKQVSKEPKYKKVKKTIKHKFLVWKMNRFNGKLKWNKNWQKLVWKYSFSGYKLVKSTPKTKKYAYFYYIAKKTVTKKVKYYKKVTYNVPVRGCVYVSGQTGKASIYIDSGDCWGERSITL